VAYYLFENPYYLIGVLALVEFGLVVRYLSDNRPAVTRALGIVPLVAGLLLLPAYWVETDREAIIRTLSETVAAADAKDAEGVLLHVGLPDPAASRNEWSMREFAGGLRLGLPYISGCRLHAPDVEVSGDTATSDLRVTVYTAGGGPVVVTADLKWARRGREWTIVGLSQVRRGAGTRADPIIAPGSYRGF
jgi:hypothetical protein